jgi:chemotaxis protein CheZ
MSNNEIWKDRLLHDDIKDKVKELLDNLQTGDVQNARTLIGILAEIKEDSLYKELGKLTRELHNTIKEIDVGLTENDIPDARIRLGRVITMTEEAANKTMDKIDTTIPLATKLADEAKALLNDWGRFRRREMSVEEFNDLYNAMMLFLDTVEKTATSIHENLQKILVAQNYQDLSGQAIKKVIEVVSIVEKKLVRLISIAGEANVAFGVGNLKSNTKVATEVPDLAEHTKELKGQDEVDDLLSSLGF